MDTRATYNRKQKRGHTHLGQISVSPCGGNVIDEQIRALPNDAQSESQAKGGQARSLCCLCTWPGNVADVQIRALQNGARSVSQANPQRA